MRAVLSVGSNVGDRLAHLRSVLTGLGPVVLAASPVYETAPWGGVAQDDFLNAVLLVDDDATDPEGWLAVAHRLECAAGRERAVRWGSRTLDVDIVTVPGIARTDPELTLPHPRAAERAFVLVPWLAVEPDAVLDGHGPVADLVERTDTAGVRRRDDLSLDGI